MNTVDMNATVKTLTETLSPTDLYNLHQALSAQIVGAPYPALILITDHANGPDEPATYAFRCPHCQGVMDELTILDVGKRYGASGSIRKDDVNAKTLTVTYDGYADFELCAYLCTDCSQPLSLPEGWTEK